MTVQLLKQMLEMQKRTHHYMRQIQPKKKQHFDEFERYLGDFIKFPGSLSVISIFFTSSSLVLNKNLALVGAGLIVLSLIIVLNIFRVQLNNDKNFISMILTKEEPMNRFNHALTIYSRDGQSQNEERLISEYFALEKSFDHRRDGSDDSNAKKIIEKINGAYDQMNVSFWLLVAGVVCCFLSTFCS